MCLCFPSWLMFSALLIGIVRFVVCLLSFLDAVHFHSALAISSSWPSWSLYVRLCATCGQSITTGCFMFADHLPSSPLSTWQSLAFLPVWSYILVVAFDWWLIAMLFLILSDCVSYDVLWEWRRCCCCSCCTMMAFFLLPLIALSFRLLLIVPSLFFSEAIIFIYFFYCSLLCFVCGQIN